MTEQNKQKWFASAVLLVAALIFLTGTSNEPHFKVRQPNVTFGQLEADNMEALENCVRNNIQTNSRCYRMASLEMFTKNMYWARETLERLRTEEWNVNRLTEFYHSLQLTGQFPEDYGVTKEEEMVLRGDLSPLEGMVNAYIRIIDAARAKCTWVNYPKSVPICVDNATTPR